MEHSPQQQHLWVLTCMRLPCLEGSCLLWCAACGRQSLIPSVTVSSYQHRSASQEPVSGAGFSKSGSRHLTAVRGCAASAALSARRTRRSAAAPTSWRAWSSTGASWTSRSSACWRPQSMAGPRPAGRQVAPWLWQLLLGLSEAQHAPIHVQVSQSENAMLRCILGYAVLLFACTLLMSTVVISFCFLLPSMLCCDALHLYFACRASCRAGRSARCARAPGARSASACSLAVATSRVASQVRVRAHQDV